MDSIKLILDRNLLDEYYNDYYFKIHPRARKRYITAPCVPSINVWFILPRPQMNNLKQLWKDFIVWWINKENLNDLKLEEFRMTFRMYMPSKRRSDPDNYTPKFLLDGFTESGFIADDDGKHLKALTLITDYDKHYPRTEIYIDIIKKRRNGE